MRGIQEILNIALKSGFYISKEEYIKLSDTYAFSYYMCDVLCHLEGIEITKEEVEFAVESIEGYLYPIKGNSLSNALRQCGIYASHEDKVAIYSDWANRPILEGKE